MIRQEKYSCLNSVFQDIHYMALDRGERALAAVAKQKADEIEQEIPSASDTGEWAYLDKSMCRELINCLFMMSWEKKKQGRHAPIFPSVEDGDVWLI